VMATNSADQSRPFLDQSRTWSPSCACDDPEPVMLEFMQPAVVARDASGKDRLARRDEGGRHSAAPCRERGTHQHRPDLCRSRRFGSPCDNRAILFSPCIIRHRSASSIPRLTDASRWLSFDYLVGAGEHGRWERQALVLWQSPRRQGKRQLSPRPLHARGWELIGFASGFSRLNREAGFATSLCSKPSGMSRTLVCRNTYSSGPVRRTTGSTCLIHASVVGIMSSEMPLGCH